MNQTKKITFTDKIINDHLIKIKDLSGKKSKILYLRSDEEIQALKDKLNEAFSLCGVSNSLFNGKVTQKMIEAETYIDKYTETNNRPPTYRELSDFLGVASTNTAYYRVRHCRYKMKQPQ